MTKPHFDPVNPKVNFPEEEKKLLDHWYKDGIVTKYLNKNKNSNKNFSFMDGPITANNPMGVHHAWGRTYKDLWQRFNNMRGFKQRFQNGFDCQGLWVEVEVEKELGIKNKKDIENLIPGNKKESIIKFVNLCKERVLKFSKIQTEQTKRLGNFMDWDNSYYTMSDENNYMIWHFLKVCYERGWIYKGRDSVPWCPRCETAISQHEMLTEDYKELTHETLFLKFPIITKGWENTSLLIWTTTPWTVPANVAVGINKKFTYRIWENSHTKEKIIFINHDENNIVPTRDVRGEEILINNYIFQNIQGAVDFKNVKDIRGEELIGLRYVAPFDHLPRVQKAHDESPDRFHIVIDGSDVVVSSEGTGLLHVAPGAGQEDFQLGKKENLPVISVINDRAEYLDGMGKFSGQNAKKHPELIINYLKNKDDGRFLFKTMNYTHRYPACWRCKTELVWKVTDEWYISMDKPSRDKQTLRSQMIKIAKKINWIPSFGLDRELDWLRNMHDWLISKPNRYWGLALPIYECKKCGNFEVIGGYEELKERAVEGWGKFEGHSPHKPWIDEVKIRCNKCNEIVERLPDVGNAWLDAGIVPYSTISKDNKGQPLYKSDKKEWLKWFPVDFITESFPGQFKNWFYSLIVMSTVLENKAPSKSILGFASLLAEDGRPMHKSWGNAIEFNEGADKIGVDVMRWMYLKQNPADNLLFGYKLADEVRRKFHIKLWNVYNYFVTYANLDNWQIRNSSDSQNILDQWIISRLNQLIEKVTENLERYDAYSASFEIENFVDDLSNWYIRRSREREDKDNFYDTTYYVLVRLSQLLAPFTPFLADIIYKNLTKKESVHLSDWPKTEAKTNKILISKMKLIREVAEKAHAERKRLKIPVSQPLSSLSTNIEIPAELELILKQEINVREIKKGNKAAELDTKITPELEEEAKGRQLIRKIQQKRKEMGVALTQKILVSNPWIPKNKEILERILLKTMSKDLHKGEFRIKLID
jgi:isoleucyl-tRNA synthetase